MKAQKERDVERSRMPLGVLKGMLLKAADDLNLDLSRSWLIGDQATDLRAAIAAGLAGATHVLTGYGKQEREQARSLTSGDTNLFFSDDISGATKLLPQLALPVSR